MQNNKLRQVVYLYGKCRLEIIRKIHLAWYGYILKNKKKQAAERSFRCNICGETSTALTENIYDRDKVSCRFCHSTLRYRSIIHLLSLRLFGKSIVLKDFPVDKNIIGLGMSDWGGYADILAEKFSYTNTFYHTDPKLDIISAPEQMFSKFDFVISSDVFEHVLPPERKAFVNTKKLLKPGGVFLFTVPYMLFIRTWEHYPELHEFKVLKVAGSERIENITQDGDTQIYDNVVFHGGNGATLELRIYGKQSLEMELKMAGFCDIAFNKINCPEFGIVWPISWSLPISAGIKS